MVDLVANFIAALGEPTEQVESGMHFTAPIAQHYWNNIHPIPPGWYMGHFLYLFGEGLQKFDACLEAWSFLVPQDGTERMIVGKNAYGALLVVENPNSRNNSVHMLDPYLVAYTGDPNLNLATLIGRWLPKNELGSFLDDRAYRKWTADNDAELELDDVLGWKVPKTLGGKFDASNIQLDSAVDYYRTTGTIYAGREK